MADAERCYCGAALNLGACVCDETLFALGTDGRPVARRALHEAFERVSNPENWKFGNSVTVAIRDYAELDVIGIAVTFFTGSEAMFTPDTERQPDGTRFVRVAFAGYYAAVGA